jgi:formylglycine-generating enzyme required for sulfatase activity
MRKLFSPITLFSLYFILPVFNIYAQTASNSQETEPKNFTGLKISYRVERAAMAGLFLQQLFETAAVRNYYVDDKLAATHSPSAGYETYIPLKPGKYQLKVDQKIQGSLTGEKALNVFQKNYSFNIQKNKIAIFISGIPGEPLPQGFEGCSAMTGNMAYIPGGKFMMGLDPKTALAECQKHQFDCDLNWFKDEGPPHQVEVGNFCIDIHEVTQKAYETETEEAPSKYKGDNLPVESITWYEARDYCQKVGKRLPTEAEWEYAAKGRKNTLYPWGNEMDSGKANLCDENCLFKLDKPSVLKDGYPMASPAGSFPSNGYGLFDMAGNVQEWVADWHDKNYYRTSPILSPQGPTNGSEKTVRGGSWDREPDSGRSAGRSEAHPKLKDFDIGFRCAQDVK